MYMSTRFPVDHFQKMEFEWIEWGINKVLWQATSQNPKFAKVCATKNGCYILLHHNSRERLLEPTKIGRYMIGKSSSIYVPFWMDIGYPNIEHTIQVLIALICCWPSLCFENTSQAALFCFLNSARTARAWAFTKRSFWTWGAQWKEYAINEWTSRLLQSNLYSKPAHPLPTWSQCNQRGSSRTSS